MNTLGDAYGYIRFLQIRPWYDLDQFQAHIGLLEKKNRTSFLTNVTTHVCATKLKSVFS